VVRDVIGWFTADEAYGDNPLADQQRLAVERAIAAMRSTAMNRPEGA
jgi:hypothetical protein